MPTRSTPALAARIARLADPAQDGTSDADLLRRFAQQRDEAAFELLVRRHGGLVLGVCRRVLRGRADADDAFQATFLALARRPGSVRRGECLAGWLHRVAVRAATRLGAEARRRGTTPLPELAAPSYPLPDDTAAVLDEEIARLPEKLRVVFVLCALDGRTDTEAAALLGCPKGTVLSRLSRAREWLRDRLTRRGMAPAAVALAVAPSGLGAALVNATVRAGVGSAAGGIAAGARVAALADFALRAQAPAAWKAVAAALVVAMIATAGAVAMRPGGGPNSMNEPAVAAGAAGPKPGAAEKPAGPIEKWGDERFLHPAEVSHVLFSPDGREVATLGGGSLRWWKLADGSFASEPIGPKNPALKDALAIVLSADNGTLAAVFPTAGRGSILSVRDPLAGKIRRTITVSDNVGLGRLALSPNGKWAVGFTGMAVVVWDLAEGKKAATLESPGVRAAAVSDDGKRVALSIDFNKTEVRSAEKGELVWEVSKDYPPFPKEFAGQPNTESHNALAFSPDGKRLATAGLIAVPGEAAPAPVRVWDIEKKKHSWAQRPGDASVNPHYREVRFSPDGKHVCTAPGNLFLFDAETGKMAHEFPARPGATGSYAVSNEGKWAAMAAGRRLLLWDTATHKEHAALVGPRSPARLIARSPDGRTVATADGGPEVWLWRDPSAPPVAVRAARDAGATELAFDPTGTRLVTVARGNDEPVRVWDAATGRRLFALGGGADKLHRAAFGRHGLFAVIDYVPGLYDPDTGKPIRTGKAVASAGNKSPVVVVSPNAEYYATDAGVFAVKDGREVAAFSAGFPLAVSEDGRRIAFRARDGTVGLHVTSSLRQSDARVKVGAVYAIAPTADRIAVVVGLSLRVYDLATGKESCACERPAAVSENAWAKWWARGVKFAPDGRLLVAHETTPGLGVWDAETGSSVAWFVPAAPLPLAAYTFSGPKTVAAAYGSGDLIRVWGVEKAPRD